VYSAVAGFGSRGTAGVRRGMGCPVPDPASSSHPSVLSPSASWCCLREDVLKQGQNHQAGRGRGNKKEQQAAKGKPGPQDKELRGRAGVSCSPPRTHTRADCLCSLWGTWTTAKERWRTEGADRNPSILTTTSSPSHPSLPL